MKYYEILTTAVLVLFLAALMLDGCAYDAAAAEVGPEPSPTLELAADTDPYPMPTIRSAYCVETVDGIWAEMYFPHKSAPELSYVHVMANGKSELPYPPMGGYWHERVGRVLFDYEWVAAECSPLHESITFILSEDLDIGD